RFGPRLLRALLGREENGRDDDGKGNSSDAHGGLLEPEGSYSPSLAWRPALRATAGKPRLLRLPPHDHEPPPGPLFLLVHHLEPGGSQLLPDRLGHDAVAVRSATAARRKVDDGDASAGLERTIQARAHR